MLQCPAQSLLLKLALSKLVNTLVSTFFFFLLKDLHYVTSLFFI